MAVLAAIDENERSVNVIRVAYDLAETYGDTLIGLHVIPEAEYQAHRSAIQDIPEFKEFSITQSEDGAKQFVRRFINETIDEPDFDMIDTRGRVGDVAEEILGEAADVDPRYLVISGRRRSPVGKAIFGNTAQKVLLNADCPVVSKLSDD